MQEELTNLVRTFEALGPIVGNAVKSGQTSEGLRILSSPAGPGSTPGSGTKR